MRGINNGRSGLLDLCNNKNKNIHIIALQEHWLYDSNLYLMNSIHPEFVSLCISSMTERLHTSVYYGRQYGGVGFLVRKSLYDRCKVGARAVSGRCLSIKVTLELDPGVDVNRVDVHFPCFSSSTDYSNELSECLSFLEDVLSTGLPSVIVGDMNFSCDVNNEGFKQCNDVLS